MSTAVQELLAAFDALPAGEKDAAAGELLMHRHLGAGDLPHAGSEALSDELFLTYDIAEAADASR